METTEERLRTLIDGITPPDEGAMEEARKRQAQLAKPPGSLGRLEELSVRLAGITGKVQNSLADKVLLVFAADNGVVEEGVSSAPQSVTAVQTVQLTRGKTGASSIAAAVPSPLPRRGPPFRGGAVRGPSPASGGCPRGPNGPCR